jgi:multiple sugar transport system permease protein
VEHDPDLGDLDLRSLVASVLAAYSIERLRFNGSRHVGMAIFLAYLIPPSILFIPLATMVFQVGIFDSKLALILTYPDVPDPVLHVAADGLFPLDSVRARGMRADRRRDALADPAQDRAAARGAGLISAGIFAFTLSWNEFIYALTFISSSETRRCRSA